MNKKNGFTLIEVIVSLLLVSIVMTSMLAALVKIREKYNEIYENTDAIVYGSSISRIINKDIIKNNGIRYVTCNNEENECDIVLTNNNKRKIKISSNEEIKKNGNKEIKEDNDEFLSQSVNVITTLEYLDTTSNPKNLLYIKSLNLTRNEKYEKKDGEENTLKKLSTSGYMFGKINTQSFKSINASNTKYENVLSIINISVYDGIDETDESNNIVISSSSSYLSEVKYGNEFTITLYDTMPTESGITKIENKNKIIAVKYGVGYFNVEKNTAPDGTITYKTSDPITNVEKPVITAKNGTKTVTFAGYYSEYDGEQGTGTQIIDENGILKVPNTYFTNNTVIYSKWNIE